MEEENPRTYEVIKNLYSTIHKANTTSEKLAIYDAWAENFDKDTVQQGYDAGGHAAKVISSHFSGDREGAVVLDVACGTGQVAERLQQVGFEHFVGIDGSKAMMEEAMKKGLYQDLKYCILEEQQLPVLEGSFDVVVICGALGVEHVSVNLVRELCIACKPGGYVCMTCRESPDNQEYKAALERELKQMEEEELWSCAAITVVENWARGVATEGDDYSTGYVYLYKRL